MTGILVRSSPKHPLTITLIALLYKHTVQAEPNWKHMEGMISTGPYSHTSYPMYGMVFCIYGIANANIYGNLHIQWSPVLCKLLRLRVAGAPASQSAPFLFNLPPPHLLQSLMLTGWEGRG